MEVINVLHMNKGVGKTSYAQNSSVQSKIISIAKPKREEAILGFLCTNSDESIGIAELGCSSGPNTLRVMSDIMDVIYSTCSHLGRPFSEFRVFLNDLYTNDFNQLFLALPEFFNRLKEEKGAGFRPCYVSAVPGSFYGRLFPSKSLHFVHSSSSLHWLSKVPAGLDSKGNKGKIYISSSSPSWVLEAYSNQFQDDFSMFLKSRSEEIVSGGRMVLSFMGRSSMDPTTQDSCYQWELLAQALMSLVREGLIEEEKVDVFNVPYYAPCTEQVKKEIEKEGSFIIDGLEAFEIDWGGDDDGDALLKGKRVATTIRAVVESMLESHFGTSIVDDLFQRFAEIVGHHSSKNRTRYINLVVSLIKKGP